MNQNFEPYKSMTPGKKVVELRKLANDFGKQPSDVDTFLAGLVDSCDCQSGFADAVLKIFEKAWKQADLKGMEMYMNLFRAFTGLEFSDFLNSAYIMATIRAQERAAEDPKEWARGRQESRNRPERWLVFLPLEIRLHYDISLPSGCSDPTGHCHRALRQFL